MRLSKKVMLSIVALPFCAALIGCADTIIVYPTFESGVVQPATSPAPIVKAPVYKNGDWWKVKVEVKGSAGSKCKFNYSDYLLEIQEGKPKLYGIDGTKKDEFVCPGVEDEILGKIRRKLKFPLRVGDSWNHRFLSEQGRNPRWVEIEYKVLGWEKVQTPKGAFPAVKLSSYRYITTRGSHFEITETYYYSPKVKAIILLKLKGLESGNPILDKTVTLVDFNLSK